MITQAYAASQPGGGDIFLQLLPFILIFFIIYFLILRPQQKRVKAHKEMIDNLRKGKSGLEDWSASEGLSKDEKKDIKKSIDVIEKAIKANESVLQNI